MKGLKIYCTTFNNDGDFPEEEIGTITTYKGEALAKAKEKPDYYALTFVALWEDGKRIKYNIEENDPRGGK